MVKKISFFFILIVLAVVFHKYFLSSTLVWGDAPYFYKEGFKELLKFPSIWTSRGNTLGGINLFIWISPIMFIYGLLGSVFHLSNDLILRVLFYFPSLIFGLVGVYLLVKELSFSKTVIFFSTLFYLVNTYYLLIVDGGQVGVVLSYGLFPLVLFFLVRLIEKQTINNFLIALIASFILTIVDFRIAAICVFTIFILKINSIKKLRPLLYLSICLLCLSAYWVIPTLRLAGSAVSTDIAGLQTTSILNSLFVFSPNWPTNQFGQTVAPYFYFVFLPILIFLPLFIIKDRKIIWLTVSFLIFAFLVKGESQPFGFIYHIFVSTKFGSVFRDSTKFFIPLILISGILIGKTVEFLNKKIIYAAVFLYLVLLVSPSILGQMNGVLGKNQDITSYKNIYNLISHDSGFIRDAWFNEKSPYAFQTEDKQALDAKDLVNFRPFASMNAGTGDHFNFMHNPFYLDWFKLLGIKYLIFSGNPRVTKMNQSDSQDWNRLISLVANDKRLKKVNINSNVPVYENSETLPNKYFVNKTYIVIGGDDVYEKLKNIDNNFFVGNQGFVFSEDGKLDLTSLQDIASTSATLIFNGKNQQDLKMNFLDKNFIAPNLSYESDWAIKNPADYLTWKYELLQNNIDTHEFDYNQGIAFSSKSNEQIKFSLNAPSDSDYYLELRSMNASGSGDLKVNFNDSSDLIKRKSSNNFVWYEKGPITLKAGSYSLNIENTGGFQVLNTVSLVSSDEMKKANQLTQNFIGFFDHYDIENKMDQIKLKQEIEDNKWEKLNDGQVTKKGWIIYTDSYNPNWVLHKGDENMIGLPMYSMVNGFYSDPAWGVIKINFLGEDQFRWGIYFSGLSLVFIIISVLWIKGDNNK